MASLSYPARFSSRSLLRETVWSIVFSKRAYSLIIFVIIFLFKLRKWGTYLQAEKKSLQIVIDD
jgi:hypothetical protein